MVLLDIPRHWVCFKFAVAVYVLLPCWFTAYLAVFFVVWCRACWIRPKQKFEIHEDVDQRMVRFKLVWP